METGSANPREREEALSERLLSSDSSDSFRRRGQSLSFRSPSVARPRLLSLDIVRGLAIALMLFVNHSGSTPWWIPHADWNGVHLADFVMPGFLVIVGASISLSLSLQRERGVKALSLIFKAGVRTAKLFAMGLFIQGRVATGSFPNFDLSVLRIMGVLQRIAICYFIMSLVAIAFLPARAIESRGGSQSSEVQSSVERAKGLHNFLTPAQMRLWGIAFAILVAYTVLSLTMPVPGCSLPPLTTACNAAAWIDEKLLRSSHMYPFPTCRAAEPPCAAFDPEGLFTTLGGGMSSTAFGVAIGAHFTAGQPSKNRLVATSVPAASFAVAGIALHFLGLPLNKNLYSGSFVLLTTGSTAAVLALAYWMADVKGFIVFKLLTQPFMLLGTNPIAIFFGDEVLEMAIPLVYWKTPENNLRDWLWRLVIARLFGSGTAGWLIGALIDVAFWTLIAAELYRRRIFFKV